jgi:phosphatidate cytidylyltransferase
MKIRIITGVLGGLLVGAVTYFGGALFDLLYLIITFLAIYEITKLLQAKEIFSYEATLNYLLAIPLFFSGYFFDKTSIGFVLLLYVSFNFVLFVTYPKITLVRLAQTLFIGMYVVLFMYHMIMLNNMPDRKYLWLVYIISFGTDTFAYFAGVFFGKHKLCPNVSPKKTVEGAIGGILGCLGLTITFFKYFGINISIYTIIFSIFVSAFSMVGDLLASKIKREHNVKDFGSILPGHGGILDRFDSLLFVAPVVYYFVNYFI